MCVPITVISATANITMELVELNPTATGGAATEEVSIPKVNASGYLGTNTSMVSNDGCCRVCLTLSGDRTVHNGWLEAMRVANTTAHAAAEARVAATTIAAAYLRATQIPMYVPSLVTPWLAPPLAIPHLQPALYTPEEYAILMTLFGGEDDGT